MMMRKVAAVMAGLTITAAAAAAVGAPATGSGPLGPGRPGSAQRVSDQADLRMLSYVTPDKADSVVPIVLEITKAGLLLAEFAPDPTVSGLAALGVYLINQLQGELSTEHAADPAAILLVIVHTVKGKQEANVYRITAGRDVQVAMNGRFIEEVSPSEIRITAQPETESTIAVTITSDGPQVYRQGTMTLILGMEIYLFWDPDKYSRANLDTGATVNVPANQTEISIGRGSEITTANGTTAARWRGPGQPSLTACASLPAQQWGTSVVGPNRFTPVPAGTAWCVHTTAGHYGSLVADGSVLGTKFSYVLWETQK